MSPRAQRLARGWAGAAIATSAAAISRVRRTSRARARRASTISCSKPSISSSSAAGT
ncbi:MAG: hypothetical protein ACOC84_10700 [Actinomycetota bacterium]